VRRGPTADKLLKLLKTAGLNVPSSTYLLEKFEAAHATRVVKSAPLTWPPDAPKNARCVAYHSIQEVVEQLLEPVCKRHSVIWLLALSVPLTFLLQHRWPTYSNIMLKAAQSLGFGTPRISKQHLRTWREKRQFVALSL
jgi:hypothetical protein